MEKNLFLRSEFIINMSSCGFSVKYFAFDGGIKCYINQQYYYFSYSLSFSFPEEDGRSREALCRLGASAARELPMWRARMRGFCTFVKAWQTNPDNCPVDQVVEVSFTPRIMS